MYFTDMDYLVQMPFVTNAYDTSSSFVAGTPWRWHSSIETGCSGKIVGWM